MQCGWKSHLFSFKSRVCVYRVCACRNVEMSGFKQHPQEVHIHCHVSSNYDISLNFCTSECFTVTKLPRSSTLCYPSSEINRNTPIAPACVCVCVCVCVSVLGVNVRVCIGVCGGVGGCGYVFGSGCMGVCSHAQENVCLRVCACQCVCVCV